VRHVQPENGTGEDSLQIGPADRHQVEGRPC
jgi:hypothetical protein